jgi:cytoskeletal protein CcmA (bactofilin family)
MSGGRQRESEASLPESGQMRRVGRGKILATASLRKSEGGAPSRKGLVIRGRLECSMAHHEKYLTVCRHARVRASLQADSVTVLGQLTGNIYSEGKVLLSRGSEVNGDIYCPRIIIEEGAKFAGSINTDTVTNFTLHIREPILHDTNNEECISPHIPASGPAEPVHSSTVTSLIS